MPTFPAIITSDPNLSATNKGSLVLAGTNRYAVLEDFGTISLAIFKSTDGGFTWSRMDQGGEPVIGNTPSATTTDGSKIFIYASDPTTSFSQFSIFDTGSDTWSSTTVTGIEAVAAGGLAVTYRASDNSLVAFGSYNSLAYVSGGTFQRCGFFIFDIGSLSVSVGLTPNGFVGASMQDWVPVNVIPGNSLVTFVFTDLPQTGGGTRDISAQSLDPTNTLGSLQTIDTITDTFFSNNQQAYGDGTTVAIIWQPSTNVNSLTVWQGASASTLTLVSQTLTPPDLELDNVGILINATLNSVYVLAFTDNGTDGYISDTPSVGGGVFSSFTREFTSSGQVVVFSAAIPLGATSWGLFYSGATPLYAEPGGGPPPVSSNSYAYSS